MEKKLDWLKCEKNEWCPLASVNLDHDLLKDKKGVYLIFTGNKVIRLGSGILSERLYEHRNNPEIVKGNDDLKVTFAHVNENQMEGIEKFLADYYKPEIGERFPNRTPIKVNLPNF